MFAAENGTPGGTSITPQPLDISLAASGGLARQVVTGLPTSSGTTFVRDQYLYATSPVGRQRIPLWEASSLEDSIVLRGGVACGLRLAINRVAAHTALVEAVTGWIRWVEL